MTAAWEIRTGDCRDLLRQMPSGSVHTCVCSPPYFGLRDYGTGEWEGGDETCDHIPPSRPRDERPRNGLTGGVATVAAQDGGSLASGRCRCGATRKDKQLGLEPTPQDFVDALVQVFREVRRVLRDDGCVFLNLGDSYASSSTYNTSNTLHTDNGWKQDNARRANAYNVPGVKPKDLIGVPWMVAFALRADGWYLRADIIWNKPNPMPESVTDRPTRSHEFIFLLTKNSRYHYDADAIREPHAFPDQSRTWPGGANPSAIQPGNTLPGRDGRMHENHPAGRNRRDVWTVSTKPYPGAHFATFPPDLIEPCVLAGCPERACSACGAPWERTVEIDYKRHENWFGDKQDARHSRGAAGTSYNEPIARRTVGFEPSCSCNADPVPGTVLDPFAGAGTTGLVAVRNRRAFIGLELNPEYAQMARNRIATDIRLGHRPPQRVDINPDQASMFDVLNGTGS